MKTAVKYTLAATLAVGASAAAHQHNGHQAYHVKKDLGSAVKREPNVVQVLVEPTATVYVLGGAEIEEQNAKKGIAEGKYIVIGESNPTAAPLTIAEKPTGAVGAKGGVFVEDKSSSSSSVSSEEAPAPTTTVVTSLSTSSAPAAPTSTSSPSTGSGSGEGKPFGDDVPCSTFPSEYGAVALDWLDLGGWSGIQKLQKYNPSQAFNLVTGIAGEVCEKGGFCTYACRPGYFSTQYPKGDQQADGTSIGGLYCNSKGKLELTNTDTKYLCQKGAGGVSIKNELSKGVAVCQTIYPGTERMAIPSFAGAGSTVELMNPRQDFYHWGGAKTTAQYYVNKAGYTKEEACVWDSPKDKLGAGNWAPMVIGVGQDTDGLTYISILPNTPTSTAPLGFNIEITGDGVLGKCKYENGVFSNGDPRGCTATVPKGKSAVYRFY